MIPTFKQVEWYVNNVNNQLGTTRFVFQRERKRMDGVVYNYTCYDNKDHTEEVCERLNQILDFVDEQRKR